MTEKKFQIFLFLTLFFSCIFVFEKTALADWEGWCWGGVGPGCHGHPHSVPPPPPTIEARCDGVKPDNVFRNSPTCTDINNLKEREVVSLLGSNFTPGSKGDTAGGILYLPDGSPRGSFQVFQVPPDELHIKADGNGQFRAVTRIDDHIGNSPTLPPGTYQLVVAMRKPNKIDTETARVALRIVSSNPQPKPEPPKPEPPKPTPPPILPSDNCNTDFVPEVLHVCFFDGTEAPTGAKPVLAQYNQESFIQDAYFPTPVGSWKGFNRDWAGAVDKTGKSDQVSAVWRGKIYFKGGTYNFHTKSDDGIELKLDDSALINNWNDHPPVQNDANNIKISGGFHNVQLRWYENGLGAVVGLWWDFVLPSGGNCDTAFPENKFHVCFFENKEASAGAVPTISQFDMTDIDSVAKKGVGVEPLSSPIESWHGFSWPNGAGHISNHTGQSDTFSAIWRGRINFKEGFYHFYTISNGGVELMLDNKSVLENWKTHAYLEIARRVSVSAGFHDVRLRWYPPSGAQEVVGLWWNYEPPKPEPKPEPTPVVEPEEKYSITIEPTYAKPGEIFKIVSWKGFDNNTKVNVYIDNQKLKSVYLSKSDLPELTILQNILNGKHTIKVEDTVWFGIKDSHIAETIIEIHGGKDTIEPTLTIDRQIILAGETTILKGENWQNGEKKIILFDINGKEYGLGEMRNLCPKTISSYSCKNGEIKYSIVTPENTAEGTYFFGVIGAGKERASVAIKILSSKKVVSEKPSISLNPIIGKPGTAVVVSGGGFEKKSGLLAKFDSEKLGLGTGSGFYADDNGAFSTIIYIPLTAKPGKHSVSFSTGIFGGSASAEFTVIGEEKPIEKPIENPIEKPIEKSPDVSTKKYEDIKAPNYGDMGTTKYGEIKTDSYGDVKAPSYGDTETTKYGEVQSPSFGDIKTNNYGNVETKTYGDVQAPTYEEPKVAPGECNPLIPSYQQSECKPTSYNGIDAENLLAKPRWFQNFLLWIGVKPKSNEKNTTTTSESKKVENKVPSKIEPAKKIELPKTKTDFSKYAGSYRCWKYNVSGGGGGNCRLFAPLVLKSDGTYFLSSEAGTFKVDAGIINLSESKIRGLGKLIENGMQIQFEYDYNGWHHTLTYLKEEDVAPVSADEKKESTKIVEVTIRVIFPEGDYSADSVNTMTLFEKGTKNQVGQSLAYPLDKQTIEAWFSKRPPKEGVMAGKVYDIYVSSGFDEWKIGELDATKATSDFEITINAKLQ